MNAVLAGAFFWRQAVDLLYVSRPHLVKLLDGGTIPYHKVGTHRRVRYQDLLDYKTRVDSGRLKALEELAAQGARIEHGLLNDDQIFRLG